MSKSVKSVKSRQMVSGSDGAALYLHGNPYALNQLGEIPNIQGEVKVFLGRDFRSLIGFITLTAIDLIALLIEQMESNNS